MKFKDIKPYIQMNGYSVNSSLRYLPITIQEYVDDLGLELNPDFQRGHVWTEEQQEKYMEHFLRGGTSGLDIYFNHTNWHKTKGKGDGWFVCVDGLQRLTACLGFMKNEVRAFGYYLDEFEDKLSSALTLRLHINSLQTRKEVLEWYLQMNSGGTVHSEDELSRVTALLALESQTNYEPIELTLLSMGAFCDPSVSTFKFTGMFLNEVKIGGHFADYQAIYTTYLSSEQVYFIHRKTYSLNLIDEEEIDVGMMRFDSLQELFDDDDVPFEVKLNLGLKIEE